MTSPAQHVGPYELIRPLGEGGMAETFIAMRRGPASFAQQVCLKRILPGKANSALFVELFLDEARLLARLQCSNIVQVYDFGQADGAYYLALELVDGPDLARLLTTLSEHGQRMPPSLALYVVSEMLTALSYAHSLEVDGEALGIVHRDISPSNILLSKHGEVKLTDFGIAKARNRNHHTQTGHTKGKAGYMSPEQIRGEAVDARSDLFSLGVVLFEMLTGVHPFDGTTDFAVQLQIIAGRRAQLREHHPDIPASIVALVDALLATDRAQRPASAADALAMVPEAGATFALQKQLAELVAAPQGARGRAEAAESQLRLGTAREQSQLTSSLQSGAAFAAAVSSATPPRHASEPAKPGLRSLLWVPLVLLSSAGLYLLVQRADVWNRLLRASSSLTGEQASSALRTPAPLPTAVGAPTVEQVITPGQAQDSARAQPVEQVITPVNHSAHAAPVVPAESVASPPKAQPTPKPQPVALVVTAAKSADVPAAQPTERIVSPVRAEPAPRQRAVDDVVSPVRAEPAPRQQAVEDVVSPRKVPRP